jgi:hypothetical protein
MELRFKKRNLQGICLALKIYNNMETCVILNAMSPNNRLTVRITYCR